LHWIVRALRIAASSADCALALRHMHIKATNVILDSQAMLFMVDSLVDATTMAKKSKACTEFEVARHKPSPGM
jgi:hypothetical protein